MNKNNFEPTNQDIEWSESFEQWSSKIPPLIFKFRSVSDSISLIRSVDIIKNHRLFLSSPNLFNDPFEGNNVEFLPSQNIDEFEKYKNGYRIISFSSNCFSAPMWAHYASECKGICIGLKTFNSFHGIKKINYRKTFYKTSWASDKITAADYEYLYKSIDWEYENEYRIIYNSNINDHVCDSNNKENDNKYFCFNEDELALVIFGEHIEKEIKDALLSIIPKTCLTFDIIADKNSLRYYLVKCETDADKSHIYTLKELYNIVLIK